MHFVSDFDLYMRCKNSTLTLICTYEHTRYFHCYCHLSLLLLLLLSASSLLLLLLLSLSLYNTIHYHHVLLWRPRGHVRYRGLAYPDTIARDACMEKEDLPVAMADREVWRQVVDSIPAPRAAR